VVENIKELYQYRALIMSLVVRELQVRYRGSLFGFLWTFMNPVLQMLVYTVVFKVYMRNDMPNYTYFLFVGLLPWNWAATSILAGTSSISDRRDLITKVKFPPQILPFTVVASALVNYLLTVPLMVCLGLFFGVQFHPCIIAFPLVITTQFLFVSGVAYTFSTFNVAFRDLAQILNNVMMFAFFLTPVLYSINQVPEKYRALSLLVNPFAAIIASYQAIFFYGQWPDFVSLGRVFLVGLFAFWLGATVMAGRRESFAEVA
jgi:lipopolysaccharide transport system permease protein